METEKNLVMKWQELKEWLKEWEHVLKLKKVVALIIQLKMVEELKKDFTTT